LIARDFENALIQICIAIDGTAKKKWPSYKPGRRIRAYITEYETFIYQFGSGGGIQLQGIPPERGRIILPGGELPEVLYKSIWCVLQHGDDLAEFVTIREGNNFLAVENGKWVMNTGFIEGLVFSVVADEVNVGEACKSNPVYYFRGNELQFNEIWADLEAIEYITGFNKVL
jgi:hypothetical protein